MTRTRSDLLADLADAVNELTEPRHDATRYEVEVKTPGGVRKRKRKAHIVTLPSLLDSLADAVEPGNDGEIATVGSFESQPSADMHAIAAEARIRRQVMSWCRAFSIQPAKTLKATLPKLVSATHTDSQLDALVDDANAWVKTARLATGYDAPSVTVSAPCPACTGRNKLVASGDYTHVKCTACGVSWPEEMIGLLAQQMEAMTNHETMTSMERCGDPECYRLAGHDRLHQDGRGREWQREQESA